MILHILQGNFDEHVLLSEWRAPDNNEGNVQEPGSGGVLTRLDPGKGPGTLLSMLGTGACACDQAGRDWEWVTARGPVTVPISVFFTERINLRRERNKFSIGVKKTLHPFSKKNSFSWIPLSV